MENQRVLLSADVRESQGEASSSSVHYSTTIPEATQQNFLRNILEVDQLFVLDDDGWSCIIAIFTFWIFVSLTLILGVYGPESFSLGPYSSILLQANSLFVKSVKVEDSNGNVNPPLKLYVMHRYPLLNVEKTWIMTHNSFLPYKSHEEWVYYLNSGSQINITYKFNPAGSSIFLAIAEGYEGFYEWLEDPTFPNTTLYWNVVRGEGLAHQKIYESSMYYISLWNQNLRDVELSLKVAVLSIMYNTSEAYYECSIGKNKCGFGVAFTSSGIFVLSSQESSSDAEWFVKVNYEPRWITYIIGIAGMTILMFGAINYLSKNRVRQSEGERAPLLAPKDDSSSCCSSYGSFSSDDKDFEDLLAANSIERNSVKEEQEGLGPHPTRRLCAICYDAPRDCFFLPCGHCISCFACASRIYQASALCPICRKTIKKVRKIFDV